MFTFTYIIIGDKLKTIFFTCIFEYVETCTGRENSYGSHWIKYSQNKSLIKGHFISIDGLSV